MNHLDQQKVLVLNRGWQIIGVRSIKEGILQMAADAATGLDVSTMTPTKWEDWIRLPVREEDDSIATQHVKIRAPRVVIAVNYGAVPKKRPRLNMGNLRKRYNNTCAITGQELSARESSKEHVVPVSKGGKTIWDNVVLAHKDVNSKRGNKTYKEVGLAEPRVLPAPKEVPISETIANVHELPEWEMFIKKQA